MSNKSEYVIAAVGIDHDHIQGMIDELVNNGATLKYICDYNNCCNKTLEELQTKYPNAILTDSYDKILADTEVKLICSAAQNYQRTPISMQAIRAGKDAFCDKPACTSIEDYNELLALLNTSNNKFYVYYCELIHNQSALYALDVIRSGRIGDVIQVIGMGPHKEGNYGARPDWFYDKSKFGGIINDIGSHQVAQFLAFTGASDARIVNAHVANIGHPDKEKFEDLGEFNLETDNNCSGYFKVDWFTPLGLRTWGDGRIFITGTKGYIELRKYINITSSEVNENNVFIVDENGEEYVNATGKVEYSYFSQLIEDSLDKSKNILDQQEILKPTEIVLNAQNIARKTSK